MPWLVFAGLFDVVDHDDIDRAFGGFKLEAELLLQRGEDGCAWIGRACGWGRRTIGRPRCLVPPFDGAYFSEREKEALWDRFFTAAPARQRRSVERYNIVKRA
jgi:hypothetical protein